MSVPGWYPDPSGAPGRYRHWDGATWSAQTTHDPTIPPPLGAGAVTATVPPRPKGPKWPWLVGGLLALVLIVGAVVALWRLTAGDTPIPTVEDSPVATPTRPTPDTSPSPAPAAVSCTAAFGSIDAQADRYTTGGLTYTAVDGWGFRFDRAQWGWIEDVAAWGTLIGDDGYAAGIVLGGLNSANGFYDLPQAAEETVTCLAEYGVFSDRQYSWDLTGATTDVDGMPGYLLSGEVGPGPTDEYPGFWVQILVVDTGDLNQLGTWVSFHPIGDIESEALIDEAFVTLRRA